MKGAGMNRRALIKSAGTLAGVAAVSGFLPEVAVASPTAEASSNSKGPSATVASDHQGVVETSAGKVRGYTRNGIFTFKGMPYGESPAGKGRFLPPTRVKPWTGLRSSMHYGRLAPQPVRTSWGEDEFAFVYDWDDGLQGEDCLCINVWSPGVNDNKKRPVMVWLHGGGFYFGSSQELPSLDGENLSRRGDVVVASINHRLGILGYLNLAEYGADYASSGNVGMLDIVLALQWVQENIGNFGGDPGNVTIFGQSGGGGKVNTIMAMPSAKGLFHRAITQSGSMLRARTPEKAAELTAAVLKELGLEWLACKRTERHFFCETCGSWRGGDAQTALRPAGCKKDGGGFRLGPGDGWQGAATTSLRPGSSGNLCSSAAHGGNCVERIPHCHRTPRI